MASLYRSACLLLALLCFSLHVRAQQIFPPGTFAIDGIPLVCGNMPVVLQPALQDVAFFTGTAIVLNPARMAGLPTPVRLYIFGHECGHALGHNEMGADCWSVRTGRDQGWFPPQAFQTLIWMLEQNPGDVTHPPGRVRLENMMRCYNHP